MKKSSQCHFPELCHILAIAVIGLIKYENGDIMRLSDIDIDKTSRVKSLLGGSTAVRRLRDMGIIEGTEITPILKSPLGDPRAYSVFGAVIAIRKSDAGLIEVDCDE